MVVNNHPLLTIKRRCYHKISAWYYICNVEFLCVTVFIMFIVCVNLLKSTYCTLKLLVCANPQFMSDIWSFADDTLT